MSSDYMVYVRDDGVAFFNPAPSIHGDSDPAIGSAVNNCTAVARGTLDQVETIVAAINATLPPMPTFDDLLEQP